MLLHERADRIGKIKGNTIRREPILFKRTVDFSWSVKTNRKRENKVAYFLKKNFLFLRKAKAALVKKKKKSYLFDRWSPSYSLRHVSCDVSLRKNYYNSDMEICIIIHHTDDSLLLRGFFICGSAIKLFYRRKEGEIILSVIIRGKINLLIRRMVFQFLIFRAARSSVIGWSDELHVFKGCRWIEIEKF